MIAKNSTQEATLEQTEPTRLIDVHHHILPPDYVSAVGRDAIGTPAGGNCPNWTVSDSIDIMDQFGVASAIVSVSAPGIPLDDIALVRKVARGCNEFAAQMASNHPFRFGFFATLPLPDIDACLAEVEYALDVLHADGVSLHANFRDRYLGDSLYTPILEELNRRKAIVFVHPTNCSCTELVKGVPSSVIEFPHDTTRTVVSLISSGVPKRFSSIRFVFSHAGGTLPFVAHRIVLTAPLFDQALRENAAHTIEMMRKFFYDTSLSANRTAVDALLSLVKPTQVLFGSDFPFAPTPLVKAAVDGIRNLGLDKQTLEAIEHDNARALFPRFGGNG